MYNYNPKASVRETLNAIITRGFYFIGIMLRHVKKLMRTYCGTNAPNLGSGVSRRGGSSPSTRTNYKNKLSGSSDLESFLYY
jgi:hypothetical protein